MGRDPKWDSRTTQTPAQTSALAGQLARAEAEIERLRRENERLTCGQAEAAAQGARPGGDQHGARVAPEPVGAVGRVRTPPCNYALGGHCERASSLDAIFQGAAIGIALANAQGRLVEVNPAFAELLGYPAEELCSMTFADLTHPDDLESNRALFNEMLNGRRSSYQMEKRYIRKDGVVIWARLTASLVTDEHGGLRYCIGMVEDITARKAAEDNLRESERRYRSLFHNNHAVMLLIDPTTGAVVDANPAALAFYGYTWPEITALNVTDINTLSRAEVFEEMARARREERRHFYFRHRLAGGETRNVEVYSGPIEVEGRPLLYSLVHDITEQKRQEAEREQLLARERRALAEAQDASRARERFIAVLSHELRTPLTPVLAGVHLLQAHGSQDARTQRVLETMERNVKLQARLVDDLLDVARVAQGRLHLECGPVRLDAVVRAAVEAQEAAPRVEGTRIHADLQPGLWVEGDFDRLQQVAGNLILNALKFGEGSGAVDVTLTHAGSEAHLVVRDSGSGIEPSVLPRIFDMFEQGEAGGRRADGLGIGLALVRSFAEAHGGRVWAESEGAGKGSRFTVALPLVPAPPEHRDEEPESEHACATLLFVEDHEDTRLLVAANLEMLGYCVYTAGSGEEALRLLQRLRPDAVISDVGLPGMDGHEFLRQARRIPGLDAVPALAMTGWGQAEDVSRTREAGFIGHLTKPVGLDALDRALRDLLNTPGER